MDLILCTAPLKKKKKKRLLGFQQISTAIVCNSWKPREMVQHHESLWQFY